MAKRRADTLLVDRGLADSPAEAQALIMAGQVTTGERPVAKPGILIEDSAPLAVAPSARYVSRGGEKLDHALAAFRLDVAGVVAADVGASTGGFTDCLLQHGASKVYAIDVGKGQLDYRLRQDPRVAVREGVNIRHLEALTEPVDIVTVDVSFISLRLVLPVVRALFTGECTPRTGNVIALLKPQFEAEKPEVPRGGVISDSQLHATIIGRFVRWCSANGFRVLDLAASPILGAAGNREFLFWLRPRPSTAPSASGGLRAQDEREGT